MEIRSTSTDGAQPGNRFVAMFDVLGFKEAVRSRSLAELYHGYVSLVRAARVNSAVIELGMTQNGDLRGIKWTVPSAVFSDTIVLWSDDSYDEADSFFRVCASLVGESIRHEMPLRGGVAFGQCIMSVDKGIFVGPAVVDAHETESIQEWVGCGLHESCFKSASVGSKLAGHEDIIAYPVPVKDRKYPVTHGLAWHHYAHDAMRKLCDLRHLAPAHAQCKYSNAIAFAF